MANDPLWMKALLGLHVAGGSLAFVLAPVALLTAKGGKAHRRWGLVYFYAMAAVAVSALVMSMYRPLLFLGLVAIFSFYNAWLAYRVLGQKQAANSVRTAQPVDWLAALLTLGAGLLLAACGLLHPALVQNLKIPSILFGCLAILLASQAIFSFRRRPQEKMFWWYEHIQGMLGSYIAAWTAFLVVTVGPLLHLGWVLWVLPTAIGVPASQATIAFYRRKFTPSLKRAAA